MDIRYFNVWHILCTIFITIYIDTACALLTTGTYLDGYLGIARQKWQVVDALMTPDPSVIRISA
jgi:hypothetical protein